MALSSAQEADLVDKVRKIQQDCIQKMPDHRVLEELEKRRREADPNDIVDQIALGEYEIAATRRGLIANPGGRRRRRNPREQLQVPILEELGVWYENAEVGTDGSLRFWDEGGRDIRLYQNSDGSWGWQRFDLGRLDDEDQHEESFREAVMDATRMDNPKKGSKIIAKGRLPRGLGKQVAKRNRQAKGNPNRHTPPRVGVARPMMSGHRSRWRDVYGDGSKFVSDFYGREWTVYVEEDKMGMDVKFGPTDTEESEQEWLFFTAADEDDMGIILAEVTERIRDFSKNPCIGLHFHKDDAEELLEAAEKAQRKRKNPSKKKASKKKVKKKTTKKKTAKKKTAKKKTAKKKTLRTRAKKAGKKIEKGARKLAADAERGAEKAGEELKEFGATKTGYTTLGAGTGAILLGPLGAILGAVGGAKLHDNPKKKKKGTLKTKAKKAGRKAKKFAKSKEGYMAGGAGAGALLLGPIGAVAGAVGGSKLYDNPGAIVNPGVIVNPTKLNQALRDELPNMSDEKVVEVFEYYDNLKRQSARPEHDFGKEGAALVRSVIRDTKAEMRRRGIRARRRSNPRRKNPSASQHQSLGDNRWNMFEDAWDSYSVSNSPEDLLGAYTAVLEAELHYTHAGIENDGGRGYGPAGAESEGIRAQLIERLGG